MQKGRRPIISPARRQRRRYRKQSNLRSKKPYKLKEINTADKTNTKKRSGPLVDFRFQGLIGKDTNKFDALKVGKIPIIPNIGAKILYLTDEGPLPLRC